MAELRFATVGDNCIDEFAAPIMQSFVGGNAVNVAVQLRRLGHHVSYFGAVGCDPNGERVRRALQSFQVDCSFLKSLDGATARTVISVNDAGDRTIASEDFGVCQSYEPSGAELEVLLGMDHVHLGWLADGGGLRRFLSAHGVGVSQDISVNADLADVQVEGLSIAFASAQSSRAEAVDIADRLLADGSRTAVVTRGLFGSMAKRQGDLAEIGIEPVEVVDTTGAGDSFIAGFLSGFLTEGSLVRGLERGRRTAALTCTHLAGFPQ